VIGGAGHFAMDCPDYAAFAEAIREKLRREVAAGVLLARPAVRKGAAVAS
jgi:hypothetical protein